MRNEKLLTKSLTGVNLKVVITMKRLILLLLSLTICQLSSRAWAAATLGSLTLTAVKCRIFTPNGDLHNDKARFELDNPEQLPVGGSVFDISGARVASLQSGNSPDVLLWDGKNVDGQVVAGGIYIYQIEFQGKTATGTVVVAR
jgi:hypothetical protein